MLSRDKSLDVWRWHAIGVIVDEFRILCADDDSQIHYERAFREFLASQPAGDDGIPVLSADDPAYAEEMGDGRITLIDG